MANLFTETEYMERKLWRSRLKILDQKWECVSQDQRECYPDHDFTLAEVESMAALANTFKVIEKVYGNE